MHGNIKHWREYVSIPMIISPPSYFCKQCSFMSLLVQGTSSRLICINNELIVVTDSQGTGTGDTTSACTMKDLAKDTGGVQALLVHYKYCTRYEYSLPLPVVLFCIALTNAFPMQQQLAHVFSCCGASAASATKGKSCSEIIMLISWCCRTAVLVVVPCSFIRTRDAM